MLVWVLFLLPVQFWRDLGQASHFWTNELLLWFTGLCNPDDSLEQLLITEMGAGTNSSQKAPNPIKPSYQVH